MQFEIITNGFRLTADEIDLSSDGDFTSTTTDAPKLCLTEESTDNGMMTNFVSLGNFLLKIVFFW